MHTVYHMLLWQLSFPLGSIKFFWFWVWCHWAELKSFVSPITLSLGLLSLLLQCTANLVLATVTSCGWYYCWWLMTDATAKTLINLTHFAASISSFFSFFSFTFSAPSFHLQCWDFCCLLLSATFVSMSFSIEMYFQSVRLIIYLFILCIHVGLCVYFCSSLD